MNLRFYAVYSLGVTALFLMASSLGVLVNINNEKDQPQDVSVFLNAEHELYYRSANYVISIDSAGKASMCGGVALSDTAIATAAHCVEDAVLVITGQGDIDLDNTSSYLNLDKDSVVLKDNYESIAQNWSIEKVSNDLAVVTFQSPGDAVTRAAEVSTPIIGCNYKAVGYGTTLSEINTGLDVDVTRSKQSIDVCVREVDSNKFIITADNQTGICFGDSGSPIFEKDTSKVVGVISSVLLSDSKKFCTIGNIAVAVRLDSNSNFLAANIGTGFTVPPSLPSTVQDINQSSIDNFKKVAADSESAVSESVTENGRYDVTVLPDLGVQAMIILFGVSIGMVLTLVVFAVYNFVYRKLFLDRSFYELV